MEPQLVSRFFGWNSCNPQASRTHHFMGLDQQRSVFGYCGVVVVVVWSPHREAPGHGVHHPPRVVSLCHDRFIRHTSPPPDSTAAHNRITAASQAARMHTVPPGQYNNTLSWRRQGMDIIIARNISKSVCVFTEYAMYTHKMAGMGEAADDVCRYEGSSSAVTTASFLYQARQSSHS